MQFFYLSKKAQHHKHMSKMQVIQYAILVIIHGQIKSFVAGISPPLTGSRPKEPLANLPADSNLLNEICAKNEIVIAQSDAESQSRSVRLLPSLPPPQSIRETGMNSPSS